MLFLTVEQHFLMHYTNKFFFYLVVRFHVSVLCVVSAEIDQEWQPEEHPGPVLHLVPVQTAAAAAAAVLPVSGGAEPADHPQQQQQFTPEQPQVTRHADVQVTR